MLPADVEVVDVGKDPRGHAASQDDINVLLVQRALAGEVVARLKGGDPFVLGRGSEEVEACVAAGVVVEVIPGVSSVTAAPALAGVPLTKRGTSQQFTVVSGHVPPGDPRSTVDWDAVARGEGTIVLLMAVANLRPIADTLMAAGRDRDHARGRRSRTRHCRSQRVVRATLGRSRRRAERENVVPPAVVGDRRRRQSAGWSRRTTLRITPRGANRTDAAPTLLCTPGTTSRLPCTMPL